MKKLILIITIATLSACSAKLITPTQSDVDRVSTKYNGYTLADLNAGKTLCEQKCTQCHSLKAPSSQTESDWTNIVPDMANKAANETGASKIDSSQQNLILKYLVTMGTVPKREK